MRPATAERVETPDRSVGLDTGSLALAGLDQREGQAWYGVAAVISTEMLLPVGAV